MKLISYSLFKGSDPLAELFYVRGFYFNVLMNSIVYPGWKTVVHVDAHIVYKYGLMFESLHKRFGIQSYLMGPQYNCETHCMKMLWRMRPIFLEDVEYVICRDTDALTSERETKAVKKFMDYSAMVLHGISDNPAHSLPLMGGMSGFRCAPLRDKYKTFDLLVSGWKDAINAHGTDQKFLTAVVHGDFKEDMMMHFGKDAELNEDKWYYHCSNPLAEKTHPSDLCTSFIGSAGCNEMETLRYLRSAIPDWGSDAEMWKQYPKLFYWL